jgi:hypothetical protein
MPVIIPERDYDRWLQPSNPDRPPIDLLRPFDPDKMTAWKVDNAVGNVKNDSPELIEPALALPEQVRKVTKVRGRTSRKPALSGGWPSPSGWYRASSLVAVSPKWRRLYSFPARRAADLPYSFLRFHLTMKPLLFG